MSRVQRAPGRRKAGASPRPTVPATPSTGSDVALADAPVHDRRASARVRPLRASARPRPLTGPALTWAVLTCLVTVGLGLTHAVDVPPLVEQGLAVTLGVLLALGLAWRAGGRAVSSALLALAIGGSAVASQWPPLLAGTALGTAVLGTCLSVTGTRPAASALAAAREVVLAQVVVSATALAVAAVGVEVDPQRFGYTVLGLALLATLALAHRLGAGLHGLGRRGLPVLLTACVALVVVLAYGAALGQWGSPDLTGEMTNLKAWMLDHLGAVPHPIAALVGIPALAWGVVIRARRRQGWWVCAFGTAGTAPTTVGLVAGLSAQSAALALAYTTLIGLALGLLLVRLDTLLRRSGGRRTRRRGDEDAARPESPRLQPLQ